MRLKEVWKLFANKEEPADDPPAEGEDWPLSRLHREGRSRRTSSSPKTIIADETFFRELKHRFGSPFGFGEYFGGGMGAEHIRELLPSRPSTTARPRPRKVDPDRTPGDDLAPAGPARASCLEHERVDLEDQVKNGKGQKQARAVKRLKVLSALPALRQHARRRWSSRPCRSSRRSCARWSSSTAAASRRRTSTTSTAASSTATTASSGCSTSARRRSSSTTRSACCRRPSTRCSTTAAAAGPSPARATAR